jgi:uncharacterized protein (TIRG00374 family)
MLPPASPRSRERTAIPRRRLIGWFVGLAIAGGAVYAAVSSAGGFSHAFDALLDASPRWALIGALAEAACYLLVGLLLHRLVRSPHVSRKVSVELALVLTGLGPLMPAAPAEGVALTVMELQRRDTPPRRAVLVTALTQWYMTRWLFAVVALGVLVVGAVTQVPVVRFNAPWFVSSTALLGFAAAAIAFLFATAWLVRSRRTAELVALWLGRACFWQPRRPASDLRARGAVWHAEMHEVLGGTWNKLLLAVIAFAACMADFACFRCALQAANVHPRYPALIIAYAAATIASSVPFLPAGIGLVESVVPTLLMRRGVPFDVALAGLLVYRALATVAPAVAGLIALGRLRLVPRRRNTHQPEDPAPAPVAHAPTALREAQPGGSRGS